MKEKRVYICEICGTEYKEKESCLKCESGHQIPLEIVNYSVIELPSMRI